MLERGRDIAEHVLNAEDREARHVALGLALAIGVGVLGALAATRGGHMVDRRRLARGDDPEVVQAPKGLSSAALPLILSVSTLSALRIWNAPASPGRTRALGLWAGLQALNAAAMALHPRRFGQQMAAALLTAGLTTAYAHEAGKLDQRAGGIAFPRWGRVGLSNLMKDVSKRAD